MHVTHTVECRGELRADHARRVAARVVDDGDPRRERDVRFHIRVQRAHAVIEDSLLVVHGKHDVQERSRIRARVVHETKPGAASLTQPARKLGSGCEDTVISEQTLRFLRPVSEQTPLEFREKET